MKFNKIHFLFLIIFSFFYPYENKDDYFKNHYLEGHYFFSKSYSKKTNENKSFKVITYNTWYVFNKKKK